MICLYIKSHLFWHYYWNIRLPCFVLSWFLLWFGTAFWEFFSIFCCTERNSELCSLLWNGSERNSENLHLFWFHRTEFRVVISSAEGFGTEFRDFLFHATTGIPWEITICSVYSVFRRIIFWSEIPNPRQHPLSLHSRSCLVKTSFGHIPSIEQSKRAVFYTST